MIGEEAYFRNMPKLRKKLRDAFDLVGIAARNVWDANLNVLAYPVKILQICKNSFIRLAGAFYMNVIVICF